MKLPDYLTLSRLFLAIVLIALLSFSFPYARTLALLVFSVAGLTDYLDGHLARTRYGVSEFGKLMDPVTDKILVCATLVCFVELRLFAAWMVVMVIAREFLVTGLRLLAATRGIVISAGFWGKHKTISQIVAIIICLAGLALQDDLLPWIAPRWQAVVTDWMPRVAEIMGWWVVIVTLVSGAVYFGEHQSLLRPVNRSEPVR